MPFEPRFRDILEIEGQRYAVAEHPAALGRRRCHVQRAGIVYCLEVSISTSGSSAAGWMEGVRAARKVFKLRSRTAHLVS